MVDRRGLLGGICLTVGSLPLVLVYGTQPVGIVGLGLAAVGVVVSYGAWQVE